MNTHFCKVGTVRPNLAKTGLKNAIKSNSKKLGAGKKGNKNSEETK